MHSTEFDSRESWLEISLEPITLEPSTMEQISGMATGMLHRAVCFPASKEVRGEDWREEMVCDVVHASSDEVERVARTGEESAGATSLVIMEPKDGSVLLSRFFFLVVHSVWGGHDGTNHNGTSTNSGNWWSVEVDGVEISWQKAGVGRQTANLKMEIMRLGLGEHVAAVHVGVWDGEGRRVLERKKLFFVVAAAFSP